jgi:hypothetical protein
MDERDGPGSTEGHGLQPSPRRRRDARLARLCAITAGLCVVVGAVTVLVDHAERPVDAATGPVADRDTGTTVVETTTTTAEPTTTSVADSSTTTAGAALGGYAPGPPAPAPLRLTAPATLAPYEELSVQPVDPCPAGARWADVLFWAVGGTADGIVVGGSTVPVTDGRWSIEEGIVAVGGIENVAWARTANDLEVRATCWSPGAGGPVATAEYAPVRVHNEPITVVPELTATWDGHTATIRYSGCPTAYLAHLTWGDAAPPPGQPFTDDEVHAVATPGAEPGTWVATIDLPGYDPAEGLWATAFCQDRSEATSIWRYLPFELDPPG